MQTSFLFVPHGKKASCLLAITLSMAILAMACNWKQRSEDKPIKCVCNYLLEKKGKEKMDEFARLKGVDIWLKWGKAVGGLDDFRETIRRCDIFRYIYAKNSAFDSLKGQMIFVYSVHSYLKNGFVDELEVQREVEEAYK